MDFDQLYKIIPYDPIKWTIKDVQQWLDFINLAKFKEEFQKPQFPPLQMQNQQALSKQSETEKQKCKIKNDLDEDDYDAITKKMYWDDSFDIKGIQNNLKNKNIKAKQIEIKNIKYQPCDIEVDKEELNHEKLNFKKQSNKSKIINKQKPVEKKLEQEEEKIEDLSNQENKENKNNQNKNDKIDRDLDDLINEISNKNIEMFNDKGISGRQFTEQELKQEEDFIKKNNSYVKQKKLIIKPFEQLQEIKHYCVSEQGAKLGRHSTNEILLLEEDVSRFHAEIYCQKNEFYLKDCGSTTGTFIRIEKQYELSQGVQIELGSNQFQVDEIKDNILHMHIFEGEYVGQSYELDFNNNLYYQIGRKSDQNIINMEGDQHLSHIHSKISRINEKIVIEDMSSTNGTWVRLSPEGQKSLGYLLMNETKFKIGISHTYICCFENVYVQDKSAIQDSNYLCLICCKNERDALISPCNHNSSCLTCAKKLKVCPICREKIGQIIRIYIP
ncbi:Sterile alpha motif/pointed domain [Pseudocohnilembus persalinus]|uniref:Sterile alpha motif/pointed domain n=1 Tax=Pseudocohnilembus persalinus TaxID=266149 RepID=A0A0V0QUL7_PSEPJ|nr:Sterile alpha motif/pointed domain [Pseudocohnilembus persalinus]|eukprot:KRX05902.1 Sterile alpha motif/pointed domain [Pseudocohnilembus persalinus]